MRALVFAIPLLIPATAHAHLGHVGELAGHSHWLAIGAGVSAAAIAALLAKARGRKDETSGEAEETTGAETEAEAEGQTA
ncbi:MAG: hypothetical protein H6888_02685 [Nitratireductor sp.]|nr:hypothetical protein [Nitratireductor sp.]MCC0019960.1 hypothetical protein [Nitratireductor sp.]